jgi:hypothetical protein
MKRFGRITGITFLILVLFTLLSTSLVKRTTYYNQKYYHNTIALLDSTASPIHLTKEVVQAGFARVSITPALNESEDNYIEGKFTKVPLAGYSARKGLPAEGIHDSIYVKAAALRTGNNTLVFISADLLIMPPNITDMVTKMLLKEGIKREQLIFSATHTHSGIGGWGPGFIGSQFAGKENKELVKWIVLQITKAVTEAIADLKPVRIGTGSFNAENHTNNRTIGKTGTKNNDFSFISLEQTGYKKAIIGSYSAHATTLEADNMEISADYPGYWARKTEETSADIALFFAGSTGSQGPVATGSGFEKPKQLGEALADSLAHHLSLVELYDTIDFSFLTLKIELPEYHMRLTTKINLSTFWSKKLMPLPENVYLQALRLGNMVWISTPSDFSGEYAKQIKNSLAAEGFSSNISSFNGSYVGYIIPGRYFYMNEYESKIMGWFGPDMGEYTMELIRRMTRIVTGSDNI